MPCESAWDAIGGSRCSTRYVPCMALARRSSLELQSEPSFTTSDCGLYTSASDTYINLDFTLSIGVKKKYAIREAPFTLPTATQCSPPIDIPAAASSDSCLDFTKATYLDGLRSRMKTPTHAAQSIAITLLLESWKSLFDVDLGALGHDALDGGRVLFILIRPQIGCFLDAVLGVVREDCVLE